jgi:hypothetical protein
MIAAAGSLSDHDEKKNLPENIEMTITRRDFWKIFIFVQVQGRQKY